MARLRTRIVRRPLSSGVPPCFVSGEPCAELGRPLRHGSTGARGTLGSCRPCRQRPNASSLDPMGRGRGTLPLGVFSLTPSYRGQARAAVGRPLLSDRSPRDPARSMERATSPLPQDFRGAAPTGAGVSGRWAPAGWFSNARLQDNVGLPARYTWPSAAATESAAVTSIPLSM